MSRTDAQIDVADSNGACGGTIETLDRVRDDRPQGFEVRPLRGDVVRGTRVKNERALGSTGKEGSQDVRQDRRGIGFRSGQSGWTSVPIQGRCKRTVDSQIRMIGVNARIPRVV